MLAILELLIIVSKLKIVHYVQRECKTFGVFEITKEQRGNHISYRIK